MNGNDDGHSPKPIAKKKKIDFNFDHRPSVISNFSTNSVISASEVTEEALEAWKALPEEIREDPSFISFKKKDETSIGEYFHKLSLEYECQNCY